MLVSSEHIVSKVLTDYGLQTTDWLYDSIQWIAEALDAIASLKSYQNIEDILIINNYSSLLPYNFISINSVKKDNITYIKNADVYGFRIDGNYIKTTETDIELQINYKGILVENGYPMYEDDFSTREALSWYIVYKLLVRGTKFPGNINLKIAYDMWLKYCNQARNRQNMPSFEEMTGYMNRGWGIRITGCLRNGLYNLNKTDIVIND